MGYMSAIKVTPGPNTPEFISHDKNAPYKKMYI